jgi:hypothetical protein
MSTYEIRHLVRLTIAPYPRRLVEASRNKCVMLVGEAHKLQEEKHDHGGRNKLL